MRETHPSHCADLSLEEHPIMAQNKRLGIKVCTARSFEKETDKMRDQTVNLCCMESLWFSQGTGPLKKASAPVNISSTYEKRYHLPPTVPNSYTQTFTNKFWFASFSFVKEYIFFTGLSQYKSCGVTSGPLANWKHLW